MICHIRKSLNSKGCPSYLNSWLRHYPPEFNNNNKKTNNNNNNNDKSAAPQQTNKTINFALAIDVKFTTFVAELSFAPAINSKET